MEASPLQRLVAEPALSLAKRSNTFLDAALFRRAPKSRWVTENEVIYEDAIHRLRDFRLRPASGQEEEPELTAYPAVVVPPEVNRSWVVDFGPEQSLVAAMGAAGFRRVVVVDWKSPTGESAGRDIDDSVLAIKHSIDEVGGRAHLLGVCQGGWESTLVAALYPESIATLTLVAAPIDFEAGEGLVKHVAWLTPMLFYRAMVDMGGGVMRGELISAGFDGFMVFERFFLKYLSLWNHVVDQPWLDRYLQLNDWYRSPKDLPGPLYLRAVRELFKENRLIQGRFVCLGQKVDMARITCPVCLVAGRRDHITPPPQVLAARDAVGAEEVLEVETPGGHIGSFMGRSELRDTWPDVLQWLKGHEPV